MRSKTETRKQEVKQEKTIKVKTVIISIAVLVSVLASFAAGWHTQMSYAQSLDQAYKNGVSSVAPTKK